MNAEAKNFEEQRSQRGTGFFSPEDTLNPCKENNRTRLESRKQTLREIGEVQVVLSRMPISFAKDDRGFVLTGKGSYETKAEIFNVIDDLYAFQVVVDPAPLYPLRCKVGLPGGKNLEADMVRDEVDQRDSYSTAHSWNIGEDKTLRYWFFVEPDIKILSKIEVSFNCIT